MALTQAERQRRYRELHPDKIKEIELRYSHSEKGKLKHKRYRERHPEKCRDKSRKWREQNPQKFKEVYTKSNHSEKAKSRIQRFKELNPDSIKESQRKYWSSEQGRLVNRRKCNKRQRELGYNELFDNIFDEEVQWHHINNVDVVALPKDIHEIYPGKPTELHRINLSYIVIQLYPDIKKEEMVG